MFGFKNTHRVQLGNTASCSCTTFLNDCIICRHIFQVLKSTQLTALGGAWTDILRGSGFVIAEFDRLLRTTKWYLTRNRFPAPLTVHPLTAMLADLV